MTLISLFVAAAFGNNFVFFRFLGICPFLGISRRLKAALSMGLAVSFVMVIAGASVWFIQRRLLDPYNLQYLRFVAFILVIASLVQLIEMYMKKKHPGMYKLFGIYLALITTNCAILGLALLNSLLEHSFLESVVFALGAGFGFTLALTIMAGIRERLDISKVPEPLRGIPIALIIAGILALAFGGFTGMI
jgi:electron transport complex protein RnfA